MHFLVSNEIVRQLKIISDKRKKVEQAYLSSVEDELGVFYIIIVMCCQ